MKNQPLKPWIKGNESITPNNFFSNALPNLEYGAWISLDIAVELYKANTIDTGYLKKSWNEHHEYIEQVCLLTGIDEENGYDLDREEKKNEKKLRNFAILATGNVRASRYIKEPKINMSKLFSGIFTSICFCNFLQDYNERNISVTYIPTTDYEKTIVVTADFVDTTIFGMPVTVKRSTQFGLFYDYFQYDLNIEELYHEYERLLQRRKELRELRKLKIKRVSEMIRAAWLNRNTNVGRSNTGSVTDSMLLSLPTPPTSTAIFSSLESGGVVSVIG